MEFVAAADITGVAIFKEDCEIISVAGEVSVEDEVTLAAGFALSLGIEQDAGMFRSFYMGYNHIINSFSSFLKGLSVTVFVCGTVNCIHSAIHKYDSSYHTQE